MSSSPSSDLVRRVIDLNYANKKRAASFKWMLVNVVLFTVFAYDLWCACPARISVVHYLEAGGALVALASLVFHLPRLLISPAQPPLTPTQGRLLGLTSHHYQQHQPQTDSSQSVGVVHEGSDIWPEAVALRWRTPPARRTPPSPPSPLSSRSPGTPPTQSADAFIADAGSLAAYMRAHARRLHLADAPTEDRVWPSPLPLTPPQPPPYQLASLDTERGPLEENSPSRTPQVWRRLHLDPQRLTEWNLNLRLWLHLTIFERVVREMEAVDSALGAAGVEGRLGALGVERLRALAASASPAAASLRALLPFLEPFADQRYAVQRIREVARGGCLGSYKWNGGGSEWEEGKPTDAELVLHLFAAYLDGQAPGGGRAFSGSHLSSAPASPPRGPRALCVHRASQRPPHYVLVVAEETVEVCAGRNNLLHTLLVLIAALAAHEPPALRLQLGRAGINILWVIGR